MKYALFTGATGGLGSQCLEAMTALGGWTVYACGTNQEALDRIGRLPGVQPLRLDITDPASIAAACDQIRAKCPQLDALIHFAGISGFVSISEGEEIPETIARYLEINLMGIVRLNSVLMDRVRKAKGRIIHVSSQSGWTTAQPFAGPYVISKKALEAYNDSLRRELMFSDVHVIVIRPGTYPSQLLGKVESGYEQSLAHTEQYRKLLIAFKPLMDIVMRPHKNARRLIRAFIKSVSSERPRISYRVGTSWALLFLQLLPESWIDRLYRLAYRISGRQVK